MSQVITTFRHKFTTPPTPLGRWGTSKYTPENPEYHKRKSMERRLSHQGNTQHCGDELCGNPENDSLFQRKEFEEPSTKE